PLARLPGGAGQEGAVLAEGQGADRRRHLNRRVDARREGSDMTTEASPHIAPRHDVSPADDAAIRATIDDYYLGAYDGDGDRMARALHPDLAKRGWHALGADAPRVDPDTFTS